MYVILGLMKLIYYSTVGIRKSIAGLGNVIRIGSFIGLGSLTIIYLYSILTIARR